MHTETLHHWQHSHEFTSHNSTGERRTRYVLALTAVTMLVEIIAGSLFGSMALLADGWHMGTHVAAFMITLFAYSYARKHASDPAFSFGTGKVGVLGGFSSAIALATVALVMVVESLMRLLEPQAIVFNAAIGVALIGLAVNLVSALLLKDHHHHHHHADHADHGGHHGHEHDHNLRAAYLHVLADALTSVLAIVALLSGKYFGWNWMDAAMGMVGAAIILHWSFGLLRQTGPILLDASMPEAQRLAIVRSIEGDSDNRVADLHLWRLSADHYAAIISVVSHEPRPAEHYKQLLRQYHQLKHISIEVHGCVTEDR
ncbi:MAG: CDF family Co(II)/Ni(II) efflux transporter DmeF [Gammaproteobacteria bacterium SHHR-1]|uniref:CDF family Co(II)/Ni(II) efflux transporter DmeF n=1 Tax=Magnetovirga frankeli TaxID=947516 RepID=UPI00129328D5|nr:CDF family Co(II)/Ni(II) efflux transporter DmeF [gamma proteobacterium SS-5]